MSPNNHMMILHPPTTTWACPENSKKRDFLLGISPDTQNCNIYPNGGDV